MTGKDDALQRALRDDSPDSDELHRRLALMCFVATEREWREPDYAAPEMVDMFKLLDAHIQSGSRLPKLWRQGQRQRHWGWLLIWVQLPIDWLQMRREPLPPGAKLVYKGNRWPWQR